MSTGNVPNNPYHAQYDPSSSFAPPPGSPPSKSSKTGCIVAAVGGVLLVGLVVCCGGGYALMNFGLDVIGAQVANQLRANPQVNEKLGEIKSCKVDFAASAAHEDNQKGRGDAQTMVFNIEGSKDSGVLTAELRDRGGTQEMVRGELRLSSGETIVVGSQSVGAP